MMPDYSINHWYHDTDLTPVTECESFSHIYIGEKNRAHTFVHVLRNVTENDKSWFGYRTFIYMIIVCVLPVEAVEKVKTFMIHFVKDAFVQEYRLLEKTQWGVGVVDWSLSLAYCLICGFRYGFI